MQLASFGSAESLLPCNCNPPRGAQQIPWEDAGAGGPAGGSRGGDRGPAAYGEGDVALKPTLSPHPRCILRAASRLGLRPNLPTVHRRDWAEGEAGSAFRKSALNELSIFTRRTGRSLRALPAPSALVAMAHD